MGIEQEISEIMDELEAAELARNLMEHLDTLEPLDQEDRETLNRILEDVSQKEPHAQALWTAFCLGCAWQNIRDQRNDQDHKIW